MASPAGAFPSTRLRLQLGFVGVLDLVEARFHGRSIWPFSHGWSVERGPRSVPGSRQPRRER